MTYDLLWGHLGDEHATPLLRSDFSDDAAWARVVAEVTKGADFGPGESYTPIIQPIEDGAFQGATSESLTEQHDGQAFGYVLLADSRTMREAATSGELTVVYVDLSVEPEDAAEFGYELGRAFRCAVGEVATVEANLSISNLDFEDFADYVDQDGVYRGGTTSSP